MSEADKEIQPVELVDNSTTEVDLTTPVATKVDTPPELPARDENYHTELPKRQSEELDEIDFNKTELPPVPAELSETPPALPPHPPALPSKDKHDAALKRSNFEDEISVVNSEEGVSLNQDQPGEITDVYQFLMIRNGLAFSDLVNKYDDSSLIRDQEAYKQRICDLSNDALSLERNYCNGKISISELKEKYISDTEKKYLLFSIATKSEYFDIQKLSNEDNTPTEGNSELSSLLEELSVEINDNLLELYSYTKVVPTPLIIQLSDYFTRTFEGKKCLNMLIPLNQLVNKTFIETNEVSNSFYFLLLRTLENENPKELILLAKDSQINAVEFFRQKFQKVSFWVGFFNKLTEEKLLDEFLDMITIFDFSSIISTILSYLYDKEGQLTLEVSPTLIQFSNEYLILTSNKNMELFEDDVEMNKHKNRSVKLTKDLENKKKKFADLERSIKDSSSTNRSNALTLNELRSTNRNLKADIEKKNRRIDDLVSNFEVIRINNNKNNEIKLINDELREEIEALTKKINEMKAKMK